jgi:hypothetical protein
MADEQTAGTPVQDGGDAAQPTTGTPVQDGRDADSGDSKAKLNLEWKAKAEAYNKLEAEVSEIKKRLAQSPAAQQTPSERHDHWSQVEALAATDPASAAALEMREAFVLQQQQMKIGDPEERDEATRLFFEDNNGRFRDIREAHKHLKDQKRDAELEDLREQLKNAQKGVKVDPNTVRTHVREVGAAEHSKREMSRKEWTERQGNLSDAERMEEQRQRRLGGIVVRD